MTYEEKEITREVLSKDNLVRKINFQISQNYFFRR